MAQPMIFLRPHMTKVRAIFVLGCATLCSAVLAQTLSDPTRPPTVTGDASTNAEVFTGPVLQSILISPKRRLAIISGQTVALNSKYGEQTLIKVSETEVVLRNGKELQTLKLFPDLDKKLVRASGK
jgi:MSHA biogenesis protein MshK